MVKSQKFHIFDLMEQQRFLEILRNPQAISKSDAGELLELRNNFPYFQLSYILTTLAARQSNSIYFEDFLKKTAITTIDRKKLKNLIDNLPTNEKNDLYAPLELNLASATNISLLQEIETLEVENTEELPEELVEPQLEQDVLEETNDIAEINPELLTEKILEHPIPSAAEKPMALVSETPLNSIRRVVPTQESVRSLTHLHAIDSYRHQEGPFENFEIGAYNELITQFIDAGKAPKDPQGTNAIDSFLKNPPKLKKTNMLPTGDEDEREDLSEKFTNNSEEFFSESLANIYSKQGKYGKAIETYKKLILTNPQKSAYFASKIIELENLQK